MCSHTSLIAPVSPPDYVLHSLHLYNFLLLSFCLLHFFLLCQSIWENLWTFLKFTYIHASAGPHGFSHPRSTSCSICAFSSPHPSPLYFLSLLSFFLSLVCFSISARYILLPLHTHTYTQPFTPCIIFPGNCISSTARAPLWGRSDML